jgi:hypothetical protein
MVTFLLYTRIHRSNFSAELSPRRRRATMQREVFAGCRTFEWDGIVSRANRAIVPLVRVAVRLLHRSTAQAKPLRAMRPIPALLDLRDQHHQRDREDEPKKTVWTVPGHRISSRHRCGRRSLRTKRDEQNSEISHAAHVTWASREARQAQQICKEDRWILNRFGS